MIRGKAFLFGVAVESAGAEGSGTPDQVRGDEEPNVHVSNLNRACSASALVFGSTQSELSDDEWYFNVGGCLGVGAAIVSFIGSWWYCVAKYGYLLGFGLGWLPSAILAFIIFFAVRFLWGIALAGVAILLIFMYRETSDRAESEPFVASSSTAETTSSEWDSPPPSPSPRT